MSQVFPLDSQIDHYLGHLKVERGLAPNTVTAYAGDLSAFASFAKQAGVQRAECVDHDLLSRFSQNRAELGHKARSQARALVALRGFFRFLKKEGVLKQDPARLLELPRTPRRLPQLATREDLCALMEACHKAPRDHAILVLLYGCGLRVSELVGLQLGSVHLGVGVLRVLGKGNKERVVPLGSVVINSLERYLQHDRPKRLGPRTSEWLFPGRKPERPMTRQAVFRLLRRLSRLLGIQRDLSPHKLRHAFATDLLRGGADLRSVQALLGHADLRTTEIYTHIDDTHLREVYDRTHPRR